MNTSNPTQNTETRDEFTETLQRHLSPSQFNDWHFLQERAKNASEGYDETRNDPSYSHPPDVMSPSGILKCHRDVAYSTQNTPREERLPHGTFKFGNDFEDYVETFLEDLVEDSPRYTIKNPLQIDYHEKDINITGSTDPVLFDTETNTPVALTEVKSTSNIFFVKRDGLKTRHKAQAHAYARGLQLQYDLDDSLPMFFIYGDSETLEVETFKIDFDWTFWVETVVPWMQDNKQFRESDELPPTVDEIEELVELMDGRDYDPDDPSDNHFMCGYCDYQERCGNYEPESKAPGVADYNSDIDDYWWQDHVNRDFLNTSKDTLFEGFLPQLKYPEEVIVSHLASYDDVKLTPTLAHHYPQLYEHGPEPDKRFYKLYGIAPQADVHDWVCEGCNSNFDYISIDWDGNLDSYPDCPNCNNHSVHGPRPKSQD